MGHFNIHKTEVEALLKYIEEVGDDVVAFHFTDTGVGTCFKASLTGNKFNENVKDITVYTNW